MGKLIIIKDKTLDEMKELGFKEINDKLIYIVSNNIIENYIIFEESKYNKDEYILTIPTAHFPQNENAYENLYNFIMNNNKEEINFWSFNRTLASGNVLKDLPKFYLDSKDGSIVTEDIKRGYVRTLSSIYEKDKNEDIFKEERVFYPIIKNQLVDPIIKLNEHLELIDLELEYSSNDNDLDM